MPSALRYQVDLSRAGAPRLDLNENLFVEPPPLHALPVEEVACYPTDGDAPLRRTLAEQLGLPTGQLFFTHGATGALNLLLVGAVRPSSTAAVFTPGWSYYEHKLRELGAHVLPVPLARKAATFVTDPARLRTGVEPSAVLLSSPNNPTGHLTPRETAFALARRFPRSLIVVDETYWGFSPDVDPLPAQRLVERAANVAVIRSFSKCWALAGLRLGFVMAGKHVAPLLQRFDDPFGVNMIAQAAALHRLGDRAYLPSLQRRVQAARAHVERRLSRLPGCRLFRGAGNFVYVELSSTAVERVKRVAAAGQLGFKLVADDERPWLRITLAPEELMDDKLKALIHAVRAVGPVT